MLSGLGGGNESLGLDVWIRGWTEEEGRRRGGESIITELEHKDKKLVYQQHDAYYVLGCWTSINLSALLFSLLNRPAWYLCHGRRITEDWKRERM